MIDSKIKVILLMTSFWGSSNWNLKMGSSIFRHCPVSNCYITRHKSWPIAEFDAILFHLANIEHLNTEELPDKLNRSAKQRYVMFFLEPPSVQWVERIILRLGLNNSFNWTMTYRLDSDIPTPYGWMVQKLSSASQVPRFAEKGQWAQGYDPTQFAISLKTRKREFHALAHRPKGIAWLVSHCNSDSERERYVNELRKHIQVDIFGQCGNILCSSLKPLTCSDYMVQNYMFYLAFENIFCDEYVTEKLWSWMSRDIVPVVLGQANYSAITPPHSVINAEDFTEPKYLAAYLKHLMADETEYLSFFWWKDYYDINANTKITGNIASVPDVGVGTMSSKLGLQPSFCKLCEMLNDPEQPPKVVDLSTWWLKGAHCTPKGAHPWSGYKSIVEERLISEITLFSSLLVLIIAGILILSKVERHHSTVIWKLKIFIKTNWQTIKLFKFNLIIFGCLVLFVILCRATLGIPWDSHFVHIYTTMKKYFGQKCSTVENHCF